MTSEWLTEIATPLEPSEGGEDLRYCDEFLAIKQEIDKLQAADFSLVYRSGRLLLAQKGKDLRVAGYLLLAAVYVEGAKGLLEAVHAYRLLIDQFWEHLHPRRSGARLSAIDWLNNPRLASLAQQYASSAAPEQIAELENAINALNHSLKNVIGESAPQWNGLNEWIQAQRTKTDRPPSSEPVSTTVPAPGNPGQPSSERELTTMVRAIREYLFEQGDTCRALALSRAMLWSSASLPPHQDGKTKIAAPRPGAHAELVQLRQNGDPGQWLRSCDALFWEPSGRFDLDLQHHTCLAAAACRDSAAEELVRQNVQAFVQRFPELVHLHFDDGRPFACQETRNWLSALSPASEKAPPACEPPPEEEPLSETLANAQGLLREKKLTEALSLVRGVPVCGESQRLRREISSARLCLQGGRPDVAFPLAEVLNEEAGEKALELWDKTLCREIWGLYLEAGHTLLRKTPEAQRGTLAAKLAALKNRICRTDPEGALQLIPGDLPA